MKMNAGVSGIPRQSAAFECDGLNAFVREALAKLIIFTHFTQGR